MADPLSLHDNIDPALTRALGVIVQHWAYVEHMEEGLLAYLIKADPGLALVVTKNVSGSTLTDWIRTMVEVRFEDESTRSNFHKLLSRIDAARAERNIYVHGLWTKGDPPSLAVVTTVKWDRSEVLRDEVIGSDDLHSLLEEIDQIYRQLLIIGNNLGFHPLPSKP
jgi:hypothetical protein